MTEAAMAFIEALYALRASIEKMTDSQERFQTEALSILTDISATLAQVPMVADTIETMARDLSDIADRYRPIVDDFPIRMPK